MKRPFLQMGFAGILGILFLGFVGFENSYATDSSLDQNTENSTTLMGSFVNPDGTETFVSVSIDASRNFQFQFSSSNNNSTLSSLPVKIDNIAPDLSSENHKDQFFVIRLNDNQKYGSGYVPFSIDSATFSTIKFTEHHMLSFADGETLDGSSGSLIRAISYSIILKSNDDGETFDIQQTSLSDPVFLQSSHAIHENNIYLAWLENDRILFSKSNDGGLSFSSSIPISDRGYELPSIAVDNQNIFVTFVEDSNGEKILILKSMDGGNTFRALTSNSK